MIVLLVIWSLIGTVWLVGRITSVSAGEAKVEKEDWSELTLFTVFPREPEWKQVKAAVGGIHRLTIGDVQEKTPKIYIFTPCSRTTDVWKAWKDVHLVCSQNESRENLMKRLLRKHSLVVWFDSEFLFDPEALKIKRAELLGEPKVIKKAFESGKLAMLELLNQLRASNHIQMTLESKLILEGRTRHALDAAVEVKNRFGLVPAQSATPSLPCHVVLRKEAIINGAILAYPPSDQITFSSNPKQRLVAIGVPTTSKGMKPGEEPVFMKTLLPSMKKTLSAEELKAFSIVVFIGFDRGDPVYDNTTALKRIHDQISRTFPQIQVVFLSLAPLERVAMTWNMIFAYARKQAPFQFFYQVNDDLTMITPGWLTRFTQTLDESEGFGVVGPSDTFNGFACSLLTQAMVNERHFQLFSGLLYPLPFRDWKSDRWLSFVYGEYGTHCWPEIEANNGAKGTRYAACPFESWRVILEQTQLQ